VPAIPPFEVISRLLALGECCSRSGNKARRTIFERFTKKAQEVVTQAQEQARQLDSDLIKPVHLLLGVAVDEETLAATSLHAQGLTSDEITGQILHLQGPGKKAPEGRLPFTPASKKALEFSLREALSLGHSYIGSEHLLLGLLRLEDEDVSKVLISADVDFDSFRASLLDHMPASKSQPPLWESGEGASSSPPTEEKEGDENEGIEMVPTHSDRPAEDDELSRRNLAEVLGERIRRVREEDTEAAVSFWLDRWKKRRRDRAAARGLGAFMVHLYAPWGAGKSSVLNFLAQDLRNRAEVQRASHVKRIWRWAASPRRTARPMLSDWIVVEFSAWQHQRLVAPWWWLLAAVQRACARELWQIHRGRWVWFWARDLIWRIWNARAAAITGLCLLALLATAWVSDWFGLPGQPLTATTALILFVSSSLTAGLSVFGLAHGLSRWLAIGSADGAVRFLRRSHDPLGVYQNRFRWLVRSSGRPIAVFIDDLDRCRPGYVVELLEGIQTLFCAEPVVYVVAADRSWLCESFASGYEEFKDTVGEPGRPLGFLFLEKTFQISFEIPPMSEEERARFWGSLLRLPGKSQGHGGKRDQGQLAEVFANASTQAEVEEQVDVLLSEGKGDADEVMSAAVRRLNAPVLEGQLELLLSEFGPLLENNPRSMKRLMNAYGMERDRLVRNGYFLSPRERRQLALLTILRLRWPLLAEHLRAQPGDVDFCLGRRNSNNHSFSLLFDDPEVRCLFDGSVVSERLNSDLLADFPARPVSTDPAVRH
jgi:hypothetical protein